MLSTPFEFQIVLTPKPMHHTESTTLVLSLQKFPRTAVIFFYARLRFAQWRWTTPESSAD